MPTTGRSRKSSAEDAERLAVGRVVEGRHQHRRVARRRSWRSSPAAAGRRRPPARAWGGRPPRAATRPRGGPPASRSRFSSSAAWFGSRGSSSRQSTMVRGPTKRARSSTWPWVSSPAMPLPSQMALRRAERLAGRPPRSRPAPKPGLRTWTAGSSRHSSVVRIVPRPFTSMAPPSRTTSRPPCRTGRSGSPSAWAARSGIAGVPLPVGVLGPGVEAEAGDGLRGGVRRCGRRWGRSRGSRRGRWGCAGSRPGRGRRRRARGARRARGLVRGVVHAAGGRSRRAAMLRTISA